MLLLKQNVRLTGAGQLFLETLIPSYNERFAKAARDPQSAWRPLPPELDLDRLFSTATERKVKADYTISFRGLTLQILREKRAAQPGRLQGNGACYARERTAPLSSAHQACLSSLGP